MRPDGEAERELEAAECAGDGAASMHAGPAPIGPEIWVVDLNAAGAAATQAWRRLAGDKLAFSDPLASHGAEPGDPSRSRRYSRYAALRCLLTRYVGTEKALAPFDYEPRGKPSTAQGGVHFSVSHSDHLAVIALSASSAVGVDVECLRKVRISVERRAQLELWAETLVAGNALPKPHEARFLQAWVRLEAVAKCSGEGIGSLLTTFRTSEITPGGSDVFRHGKLRVHDLHLATDVAAVSALATMDPGEPTIKIFPDGMREIECLMFPTAPYVPGRATVTGVRDASHSGDIFQGSRMRLCTASEQTGSSSP